MLNLDGHSYAHRLLKLLATNSLVIKEESLEVIHICTCMYMYIKEESLEVRGRLRLRLRPRLRLRLRLKVEGKD